MFVDCFASYLRCVGYLLHVVTSSEEHMVTEAGEDMAVQDGHPKREQHNSFQHMIWEQLEVLTIDVSKFSLLLVAEDESGINISSPIVCYKIMLSLFECFNLLQVDLKNFSLRLIFI